MSPRTILIGFVVALAAGVATLLVSTGSTDTGLRAGTGVAPAQLMAILQRSGDEVCQLPLRVPAEADRVRLVVAPGQEVRGPVRVEVRRLAGGDPGRAVAAGTLPRRRLTGGPVDVDVRPAVATTAAYAVCVESEGGKPVEVWGQPTSSGATPATSAAEVDGEPLETDGDLYLEFPRDAPASKLSQLSAALSHAAPFKLGGMGAWVLWALLVLLVAAVVALAVALTRAARGDDAEPR